MVMAMMMMMMMVQYQKLCTDGVNTFSKLISVLPF